jgi:hypothetical protein
MCKPGWTGSVCDLPEMLPCASQVIDSSGKCCESGVLSSKGVCCPLGENTSIDKDGSCCADGVDACGICGGRGKAVDIRGVCCEVCLVLPLGLSLSIASDMRAFVCNTLGWPIALAAISPAYKTYRRLGDSKSAAKPPKKLIDADTV